MKQTQTTLVFGSNTGNAVYFRGTLVNRYSREKNYYGIITGWRAAMNYNMDATYYVDVFKDDEYVTSIVTTWGDLTDK